MRHGYICSHTYMMKGEQQKIFHKGSNSKINAFITLIHPSNNKIKFKITKSRTSNDFIDHLRSIQNYVKNNKIKRFILVTDNASFHVSKKTKQFIEKQSSSWLTVIFLPKRSPNLNPVQTRINRNLKIVSIGFPYKIRRLPLDWKGSPYFPIPMTTIDTLYRQQKKSIHI